MDLSQATPDQLFAALPRTPANFAQQYGPVAARAASQINVDPSILLGQWGHETGWGKSIIPGTNNLGNIKDPSGKGPTATDNMTGSKDAYAAYKSTEEFADSYANLIKTRYPGAVGAGSNVQQFMKGINGYAEDANYPLRIAAAQKSIPERILGAIVPSAQAAETGPDLSKMSDADLKQAAGLGQTDLSSMSEADLRTAAGLPAAAPPAPPPPGPTGMLGNILGIGDAQMPPAGQSNPAPLGGFLTGVGDFVKGGTRAIVHGLSSAANYVAPNSDFAKQANAAMPDIDATMQGQNAQYAAARAAQGGTGTDWARIGGQIAPALAIPQATGGIVAPVLGGAASGALSGAINTQPGESYGKNMGIGAAVGAPAAAAAVGVGNVLRGATMTPEAQKMVDMGVTPLPGQALGGAAARTEAKATSIPMVGDAITSGGQNGVRQFNRGMYQNALAPIGKSLPNDVAVGSEGVKHVADEIGQVYKSVEPQAQFVPRGQFIRDVSQIQADLAQRAPTSLDQFNNVIDGQITKKLQNGVMNGEQWGDTRSTISGIARNLRIGNSTPADRTLSNALDDLNEAINTQVARNSPPEVMPQIQAANAAWARYKQIETAAGSTGASNNGNVFTPAQLTAAVRKGSTNAQKATNSGLNADVAQAAQTVLGSKYADSGTAGRSALMGVPTALGGLGGLVMAGHPVAAGAGAMGLLGGTAAYGTEAGRRAMLAALFSRPDIIRQMGGGIANSGNLAGFTAANLAGK